MSLHFSFHHFRVISSIALLPLLLACEDHKAQRVVDDAINVHGGHAYESFLLEFDFRARHYTAARDGGIFSYTRTFVDSTGHIKDVLNNHGFTRYQNSRPVELKPERAAAFSRSVNSVIYFALLPFGLNDDAVRKELLPDTSISGEPYHLVRVTFETTGGGDDHEDIFLYWFHRNKKTMDYLAYSYETDGGGLRFRKAVNPRREGGILLQDYINYKPKDEGVSLGELQSLFMEGKLEKLSEIRIENVRVGPFRAQD